MLFIMSAMDVDAPAGAASSPPKSESSSPPPRSRATVDTHRGESACAESARVKSLSEAFIIVSS